MGCLCLINEPKLVLVRIYQSPVGVEPFGYRSERINDELSALGDGVSAIRILLDRACLDLLVETLFECAVISYVLGSEYLADGFLCEGLVRVFFHVA